MSLYLGLDIGGTNLRAGVVDDLRVIHETRSQADFSVLCKTHAPAVAWQYIVAAIRGAALESMQRYPQIAAIGIGFPGFIDPVNGCIVQSPNFPGLRDVDLANSLSESIGCPVIVENDALAAAFGEFKLHRIDSGSLIYLGLGTGVGGGLIHASKPYPGQHGVAMEVGHLIIEADGRLCGCGNRGCMEQYASASGVSLTYQQLSGFVANAMKIAKAAEAGDPHAIEAYRVAGASLAQALAHVAKVVDVGQVIIGGGMSLAWPLMQQAFHQRLHDDLIPALRDKVSIRISHSGDVAGIVGAALLAADKAV